MPTISTFYGISIRMYFDDHPPPHLHAVYNGLTAQFDLQTGEVIEGKLPKTATRLVKEWIALHRDALVANWERAEQGLQLERVEGLR
jgi:hypothetical protein